MKHQFFIALLSILFNHSLNSQIVFPDTPFQAIDLEIMLSKSFYQLSGPVKSVKWYNYSPESSYIPDTTFISFNAAGNVIRWKEEDDSFEEFVFSETNNIHSRLLYYKDTLDKPIYTYEYDAGGFLTSARNNYIGKWDHEAIYTYDSKGRITSINYLKKKDNISYAFREYVYDSLGRLEQCKQTNKSFFFVPLLSGEEEEFIYSGYEYFLRKCSTGMGRNKDTFTYTCLYNKAGKPEEEKIFANESEPPILRNVYQYDDTGQLTFYTNYQLLYFPEAAYVTSEIKMNGTGLVEHIRTVYPGEKPIYTTRIDYEFDHHGNWVKQSVLKTDEHTIHIRELSYYR